MKKKLFALLCFCFFSVYGSANTYVVEFEDQKAVIIIKIPNSDSGELVSLSDAIDDENITISVEIAYVSDVSTTQYLQAFLDHLLNGNDPEGLLHSADEPPSPIPSHTGKYNLTGSLHSLVEYFVDPSGGVIQQQYLDAAEAASTGTVCSMSAGGGGVMCLGGAAVQSSSTLSQHMKPTYSCNYPYCSQRFSDPNKRADHHKEHFAANKACPYCGDVYGVLRALIAHMKNH